MNKTERQKQILDMLAHQGQVDIVDLCQKFNVVSMTIRRDLNELAHYGYVVRTHGGAILHALPSDTATPFTLRTNLLMEEKATIANCARQYVTNGQRLFLASGSTVDVLAQTLEDAADLTVVTNAINIAYRLSAFPNLHLLVLGGETRPNSLTLTGSVAVKNMEQFQIDAAFIGINAIDGDGNFYASSIAESAVLQCLFTKATHVFILADSSKFNKTDFVHLGSLNDHHTLITTAKLSAACLHGYRALGAHVIAGQDLK